MNTIANPLNFEQTRWMADGLDMDERGLNDGAAGVPRATEHPYYFGGYRQGDLLRRGREREIILALIDATECRSCGANWDGSSDFCAARCDNGAGTARLQHGLNVVHGPYDPGDPPLFMSLEELRLKVLGGLWVFSFTGDCLNPEILLQ